MASHSGPAALDIAPTGAVPTLAGMTLMVLAQNLGHSDTRMVERHYGHLDDDYKRDMIRATAPTFGIEIDDKVADLV